MIVIYDKANTLTLSYTDEDKKVQYKRFIPGTNEVEASTWEKIKEAILARPKGDEQWAYYQRFLRTMAEDNDTLNYDDLNGGELADLIENTMEIDALAEIEAYEDGRDKPRKSVKTAIEKQIKKISDFNESVENG